MEQVLFRLHVRVMSTSCGLFGRNFRKLFENAVLIFAIFFVIVLALLHRAYVSQSASNCLINSLGKNNGNNIPMHSNAEDILRIQIGPMYNEKTIFPFQRLIAEFDNLTSRIIGGNQYPQNSSLKTTDDMCSREANTAASYLFSLERGYLLLNTDKIRKHNMSVFDVYVEGDSECFGSPLYAGLLSSIVGYDTVVKNWVIKSFGGRGYLYNVFANVRLLLYDKINLLENTDFSIIDSS